MKKRSKKKIKAKFTLAHAMLIVAGLTVGVMLIKRSPEAKRSTASVEVKHFERFHK